MYNLSLRLAPDGHIPLRVRIALQVLMRGAAETGYPFRSESDAEAFFRLVLVEAQTGTVRRSDGLLVPIPWQSWTDIDMATGEAIARDFFVDALMKTRSSALCGNSTDSNLIEMMTRCMSVFRQVLNWSTTQPAPSKAPMATWSSSLIRTMN